MVELISGRVGKATAAFLGWVATFAVAAVAVGAARRAQFAPAVTVSFGGAA